LSIFGERHEKTPLLSAIGMVGGWLYFNIKTVLQCWKRSINKISKYLYKI